MPGRTHFRNILLSTNTQLVVGFVIPTIILLTLSGAQRLGPLWSMVLALAFPLVLEIYGFSIRRKPSYMSMLAILGILVVGIISLLGLGKEWLAVRRSIVYAVAGLGLIIALHFRRGLVDKALARILNMDMVHAAAREKNANKALIKRIDTVAYLFAVLLLVLAVVTYVLTIVFITAPTGSAAFNAQYAELRVLGIVATTVPLLIGSTALILYLVTSIEKMTGIKAEELIKKKTGQ